jgi:sulfhydrogenase subunit delta
LGYNGNMRIAVFDLTDCEGCEVILLSLQDELVELSTQHQLVNFRFISDYSQQGPFDLTFIEGMVSKPEDIQKVKYLRSVSKILVTLGACATTGGINAILSLPQAREQAKTKIYNSLYKLKSKKTQAVGEIVKVDFAIRGCPPDKEQIKKDLVKLLKGEIPNQSQQSVCSECSRGPFKSSKCLVTQNKKCLGAFTWAGCQAVCVENGLWCWGCWGLKPGITESMIKKTLPFLTDKEIKDLISSFNANIYNKT